MTDAPHESMQAMHDAGMAVMGPAMMLIWALFGIALLALLVASVLWLVARSRSEPVPRIRSDGTALAELERRYARGEVDREMFLQTRSDLLDRG